MKAFLEALLGHLRGRVVLLWDGGPIHKGKVVQECLSAHRRLRVEGFPAYAPELNPAEFVWAKADRALANRAAGNVEELRGQLWNAARRVKDSQRLLWSCLQASELPWL